eukprot:INCI5945.3.p1 GENE.INCI5945.3~~INCI5945.3.p1  ORF type:complete len:912 (-),score=145.95 INCI5945.3:2427-4871(-)
MRADFYVFTHISSLEKATEVVDNYVHQLAHLLTAHQEHAVSTATTASGDSVAQSGAGSSADQSGTGKGVEVDSTRLPSKSGAGAAARGTHFGGVLVAYVAPAPLWKTMVEFVGAAHSGIYASSFDATTAEMAAIAQGRQHRELYHLATACRALMRRAEKECPALARLHRLRFVSPLDFCPIFDRIKSRQRRNFRYWFQQTSYDVPKIIDAILRLRCIGRGIPVLRFDQDVIFPNLEDPANFTDFESAMARVSDSIHRAVLAYRQRSADCRAQTWWFSGQYGVDVLQDILQQSCEGAMEDAIDESARSGGSSSSAGASFPKEATETTEDPPTSEHSRKSSTTTNLDPAHAALGKFVPWQRAFSTRAGPALRASAEICDADQFVIPAGWKPPANVLDDATDCNAMLAFYGLKIVDSVETSGSKKGQDHASSQPAADSVPRRRLASITATGVRDNDISELGMSFLGASPLNACISGAAFSTSPGLTLDLPPFSHFRLNVMWIDDHTLVSAAKAIKRPTDLDRLREFRGSTSNSAGNPVKWREPPCNVAWYTLEIYMPTLLWGCILDGFMTGVPLRPSSEGYATGQGYLLKLPRSDIQRGADTAALLRSLSQQASHSRGPFVDGIRQVMACGYTPEKHLMHTLRRQLRKAALERVKDCYWVWTRPKLAGTFCSLWASGQVSVHPQLGPFCVERRRKELRAVGNIAPVARELNKGAGMVRQTWHEIASRGIHGKRSDLPDLTEADLNPALVEDLDCLLDDCISYLEWLCVWPNVVQAVRSVDDRAIASDLTWTPEYERRDKIADYYSSPGRLPPWIYNQ